MIRARAFLALVLLLGAVLAGLMTEGTRRGQTAATAEPGLAALAGQMGLTDLALWTEARYTRHPSQADLFSAFQDLPGALDHFPAGSVVAPPLPPRTP